MPIFQDNRELLRRLGRLRILFVLIFLLLFTKLWFLTILNFERYRELAERNRIRTFPQIAPRGLIHDREGRVLVDNVYGFNLLLFREEGRNTKVPLDFLKEGFQLEPESVLERLRAAGRYTDYQPVVVKENLSMEETTYFLSHQAEHPELGILKQPRRFYRYGIVGAHVLGYVGEISPGQLEESEFAASRPGDLVGQYGVERSYDRLLRGQDGMRRVLVDSRGKSLQDLERVDPVMGQSLRLTLDLDLQAAAEALLGNDPGGILAFDPRSGEVLVMASRPTFDPNLFARRITRGEWESLIHNPDNPLQNRTIQNSFSPGSIFKVILALAGLERGVIDPGTSVYCGGGFNLDGHWFKCWRPAGHGRVRLKEAIQHSCNVYFYSLGQKLGIQEIAHFSRRVGLGIMTGIDLLGELTGLVPSEQWKQQVRGEPWYAGETISVAVGQGPLLVTPAQLARAIGVIATGRVPALRLLLDPESGRRSRPSRLDRIDFDPTHVELLREAMWSVVNEWGTGHAARVADFQVCGKTGTAQTISNAARERLSRESARDFEPNAWFVGFAPRDDPEIVIAVIVQRGGAGGSTAAPIAGEILRLYHQKYRTPPASVEVAAAGRREKEL